MGRSKVGVVMVMVALGACSGDDGNGPPLDPHYDANPADADTTDGPPVDAQALFAGRVCVVSDLRVWTSGCDDTTAGDLTVSLGSETATTAADGTFMIERPDEPNLRLRVSGASIVTSLNPFDPSAATQWVVAPTRVHWLAVQTESAFVTDPGNGSVLIHVTVGGAAAGAIEGSCAPASPDVVHYSANASAEIWSTESTDASGKLLVSDLPAGPATLTATRPSAMTRMIPVHIEGDAITFDYLDLPPQ